MEFCTGSLFCGGVSSLVITLRVYLDEEERTGFFYLRCRVAVYVDVSSSWCLGLSAVCDVVYPGHTQLHTYAFVEFDHEMISTVILFLPLIKKGFVNYKRTNVHEVLVNR